MEKNITEQPCTAPKIHKDTAEEVLQAYQLMLDNGYILTADEDNTGDKGYLVVMAKYTFILMLINS